MGCYRSNEVHDTHLLAKWIRDLKEKHNNNEVVLTELHVSDLSAEAVNEMLVDLLSLEPEKTMSLATVVHKKTHGNVFFVIQYLKLLQENDILEFNLGLMKWIWSLEEIETKTGATDNVVTIMQKKMESLPNELCEVLSLAACLGATFQAQKLSIVMTGFRSVRNGPDLQEQAMFDVQHWLQIGVDEGFIQKVDEGVYSWVHDKIQEAALKLVVPEKLNTLQYRVGEVLLQRLSETELSNFVFSLWAFSIEA